MSYWIIEDFLSKEEHEHYLNICDNVYKQSRVKDNVHYSWNGKDNLNKVEVYLTLNQKLRELASHPNIGNKQDNY